MGRWTAPGPLDSHHRGRWTSTRGGSLPLTQETGRPLRLVQASDAGRRPVAARRCRWSALCASCTGPTRIRASCEASGEGSPKPFTWCITPTCGTGRGLGGCR